MTTAAAVNERTLFGQEARFAGGLHEVAPGTFAWLQPNGAIGESNAGLIVGDGEALLVDTLWDLRLTQRMLDAIAATTDEPITTVVNTHSDGDHCWGNELVADAQIISSKTSCELMREDPPKMLAMTQRLLKVGGAVGRLPIPIVGTVNLRRFERIPLDYLSTLFTPYEFAGITLTPPTREFEGQLDLTIGGRAVQLIEVGPAHTAGDLVVWVPDVRTCFTADVLFNGETPIMWAGPASNWIAALDTVIALDPAVVVPGHGPVGTVDDLRVMRDYFSWVKRVATPLLEAGQSPSQAATTMLTSAEFAESPWATWDDAARLVVTLEIENRRRRGISKPLVGPARLLAFIRMGRVASALGLLP